MSQSEHTEVVVEGGVPEKLDKGLVQKVSREHQHNEIGWHNTSGSFFVKMNDLTQVGTLMQMAREHNHSVSFDGNNTITFIPRNG